MQVLGAKRKTLSGFSTANAALHQGFIYACEIMEQCPEEFRSKAARLVGAKCSLLARSDAYGTDPSGSSGAAMKVDPSHTQALQFGPKHTSPPFHSSCQSVVFGDRQISSPANLVLCKVCPDRTQCFQEEMLQKIEKWQELPPGKTKNVLPVPDLEPKKRRGGKRSRKLKEKYGVTDMQKAQNRMKFNEAEEEIVDGDEVVGLGMMGKGGIGKLGALQVAVFGCSLTLTAHHVSCSSPHAIKEC